jgi:hypothetical protein
VPHIAGLVALLPRASPRALSLASDSVSVTAEQLTFELSAVGGWEPPMPMEADHPIQRLAPGNSIAYHLVVVMGTAMQTDIALRWREGNREFSDVQTIRL